MLFFTNNNILFNCLGDDCPAADKVINVADDDGEIPKVSKV